MPLKGKHAISIWLLKILAVTRRTMFPLFESLSPLTFLLCISLFSAGYTPQLSYQRQHLGSRRLVFWKALPWKRRLRGKWWGSGHWLPGGEVLFERVEEWGWETSFWVRTLLMIRMTPVTAVLNERKSLNVFWELGNWNWARGPPKLILQKVGILVLQT